MSSGRVCGASKRGGFLEAGPGSRFVMVKLWKFRLFSSATHTCLSRLAQILNVR